MIIEKITKLINPSETKQTIVLILGCQRSGTTLLLNILKKNRRRVKTYGEFSELSSMDKENGIRLNPFDVLKEQLSEVKQPMIALKPIVEIQNANQMLDQLENAKIVWIYRNYRDVIASNLKKWGRNNGISDLTPIVENQQANWRSENVPGEIRELVKKYYSLDMNPCDAAALFWYIRNSFFFEQQLHKNKRVIISKYEDLVRKPLIIMQGIYRFCGYKSPGKISVHVNTNSLNKGKDIKLSAEIDELCANMHAKLDNVYSSKYDSFYN